MTEPVYSWIRRWRGSSRWSSCRRAEGSRWSWAAGRTGLPCTWPARCRPPPSCWWSCKDRRSRRAASRGWRWRPWAGSSWSRVGRVSGPGDDVWKTASGQLKSTDFRHVILMLLYKLYCYAYTKHFGRNRPGWRRTWMITGHLTGQLHAQQQQREGGSQTRAGPSGLDRNTVWWFSHHIRRLSLLFWQMSRGICQLYHRIWQFYHQPWQCIVELGNFPIKIGNFPIKIGNFLVKFDNFPLTKGNFPMTCNDLTAGHSYVTIPT